MDSPAAPDRTRSALVVLVLVGLAACLGVQRSMDEAAEDLSTAPAFVQTAARVAEDCGGGAGVDLEVHYHQGEPARISSHSTASTEAAASCMERGLSEGSLEGGLTGVAHWRSPEE